MNSSMMPLSEAISERRIITQLSLGKATEEPQPCSNTSRKEFTTVAFKDKVCELKSQSDHTLVHRDLRVHGARDWKCLRAAMWK